MLRGTRSPCRPPEKGRILALSVPSHFSFSCHLVLKAFLRYPQDIVSATWQTLHCHEGYYLTRILLPDELCEGLFRHAGGCYRNHGLHFIKYRGTFLSLITSSR